MPNTIGIVTGKSLEDTADAIRVLNGSADTYYPSEMASAILSAIPTETASGNPIHITDAAALPAESVVTTLEPVQDLHGYDKPWPAGGGKNKLAVTLATLQEKNPSGTWANNVYSLRGIDFTVNFNSDGYLTSIEVNGTATSTSNLILTATEPHDDFLDLIFNGCPIGGSGSTYVITGYNNTDGASINVNDIGDGATIPSALSGKSWRLYISIFAGYTASNLMFYPMIRGSGTSDAFEPYANICPISGHTGVELTRTGKNLLKTTHLGITWKGITSTVNTDDSISFTGQATENAYFTIGKLALKAGTYIVNGITDSTLLTMYVQLVNEAQTAQVVAVADGNKQFTLSAEQMIVYRVVIMRGYSPNGKTIYPMIRPASDTDSTFAPYTPETHSVTFPQAQNPVYGCEADWTNGVLRVTKANVDMGTLSWTQNANDEHAFNATLPSLSVDGNLLKSICSKYATCNSSTLGNYDYGYAISNPGIAIYVKDIDQSLSTIKNSLSGVQLVYELATPIEIPLTPEVITLLKGENNIWLDAGTSEIEYKVDLNSYIQKLIDEASTKASTLSASPLSLGRSAAVSTDGEDSGEAEEVTE